MVTKVLLSMENICKRFPGVQALDNVNISILPGEVMALVGENGAGKSTLMKILSGIHQKDSGRIFLEENEINVLSPIHSQKLGISIIHQELNLMPNLSIGENIFMGREKTCQGIFLDKKKTYKEAKKFAELVGLHVDPDTPVRNLSIAQRQMVEVARALSLNSKLIIMDEPTSSLAEREINILTSIIKDLKSKGVSVIFISHKLDEIFDIADRVTVLRDGKVIETKDIEECTEDTLIQMMVGRELTDMYSKAQTDIGDVVLEVKGLSSGNTLKDISFNLKRGEILGFSGLVGAGRSELMRAIFAIDKPDKGEIYLEGTNVHIKSPSDAIALGIGFVPEDRKLQGLILGMAVRENITLSSLENVSQNGFLKPDMENSVSQDFIERLSIKTPHQEQKVVNLSGGNQQKVVISKWLAIKPKILILDEPTRGIDVGAKKEIHTLMSKLAKDGVSIIMISSELPEVMGMSDRIIVMNEGTIKGELLQSEATQEKILALALKEISA